MRLHFQLSRFHQRRVRQAALLGALLINVSVSLGFAAAQSTTVGAAQTTEEDEAVADRDYDIRSGAIRDALDEFSTRYAGKYSPSRHLTIMRLKGPEPVASRFFLLSDGPMKIEFVIGAKFNYEEASALIRDAALELSKECKEVIGASYDFISDSFVIDLDRSVADAHSCSYPAEFEGLPLRTRVTGKLRPLSIRGGGTIQGINACTAGFTVQPISGDQRYVLGAEHCGSETLERIYTTADSVQVHDVVRVGGVYDADRDVQWLAPVASTTEVEPRLNATNFQIVQVKGVAPRRELLGEHVCHNGRVTGVSCGIVSTVSYDPDLNADEVHCNHQSCNPVWIQVLDAVEGGHELKYIGGDSGSPWFLKMHPRIAMGITHGGRTFQQSVTPDQCDEVAIMHLDMLSGVGLKLSTSYIGIP